jgi:hypothetical protein
MIEKPPIIQRDPPDARAHPRARTLLAGLVCYRDYSTSFDCTIRDLSEVGARLRIASSSTLPSQFYLINIKAGLAYDAEIAWIQNKDIGVSWKEKISLAEPDPKVRDLRRLWMARR